MTLFLLLGGGYSYMYFLKPTTFLPFSISCDIQLKLNVYISFFIEKCAYFFVTNLHFISHAFTNLLSRMLSKTKFAFAREDHFEFINIFEPRAARLQRCHINIAVE